MEIELKKLMEDMKKYKDNEMLNIYDIQTMQSFYKDLETMIEIKSQNIIKLENIQKWFRKFKRNIKEMKGLGLYKVL